MRTRRWWGINNEATIMAKKQTTDALDALPELSAATTASLRANA
jgi:hypothetical protein